VAIPAKPVTVQEAVPTITKEASEPENPIVESADVSAEVEEIPQSAAATDKSTSADTQVQDDDDYPQFSDEDAPPMSDEDYEVFAGLEAKAAAPSADAEKVDNRISETVETADITEPDENVEAAGSTEISETRETEETSIELEPEPASEPTEPLSDDELKAIWQKALDQLQMQGEMVMYLFGKTAAVQLCGNEFNVIFASQDKSQYEEFSKATSQKALLQVLIALTGRTLKLKIRQEDDPEQAAAAGCAIAEEPWIRKIRETADQFGIPVKMED
ncbi:MAG: hypothetical protein GX028_04320, partial [Clostridiaceae bacterium]|nr:hypothetical protein [Clostridiaceae bacterium]